MSFEIECPGAKPQAIFFLDRTGARAWASSQRSEIEHLRQTDKYAVISNI
jgi:hypothetical protein